MWIKFHRGTRHFSRNSWIPQLFLTAVDHEAVGCAHSEGLQPYLKKAESLVSSLSTIK